VIIGTIIIVICAYIIWRRMANNPGNIHFRVFNLRRKIYFLLMRN